MKREIKFVSFLVQEQKRLDHRTSELKANIKVEGSSIKSQLDSPCGL
jgi:hypothetical protein